MCSCDLNNSGVQELSTKQRACNIVPVMLILLFEGNERSEYKHSREIGELNKDRVQRIGFLGICYRLVSSH